jgi:hypothetical protein
MKWIVINKHDRFYIYGGAGTRAGAYAAKQTLQYLYPHIPMKVVKQ